MENPDRQQKTLHLRQLMPWMVLALSFIFYCATLNRWVNLNSLDVVAKITGWDWTKPLQGPVFYLLTLPATLAPSSIQPVLLNALSAGLAACTLAVLCRIVLIIPQDRTREQRMRERGPEAFPSTGLYWIGPLFAVLVAGLQLTFWEHATSCTGEMLNTLMFSCLIWFLLEYRRGGNAAWLCLFSFLLALTMSNTWTILGYLPVFGVALLWMTGPDLFDAKRLGKMGGCFLIGLIPYAVLPAAAVMSGSTEATFWYHLKQAFIQQKDWLAMMFRVKNQILLLTLTSIIPMAFIAIKWPSSLGDTSAIGGMLSGIMFKFLHAIMLSSCVWVAFDPDFSPRKLGFGLPMMGFYILGAIATGYFTTYFALLFSVKPQTRVRRRGTEIPPYLALAGVALVCVLVVGATAGLLRKNWEKISDTNSDILKHFAFYLQSSINQGGFVGIGDNRQEIILLEALQSNAPDSDQQLYLDTNMLDFQVYIQHLARKFGDRFPVFNDFIETPSPLPAQAQLNILIQLSQSNPLAFLHPSFGYVMELFYAQPRGLANELNPFGETQLFEPPIPDEKLETTLAYWESLQPFLKRVAGLVGREDKTGMAVGQRLSLRMNDWGVQLQRSDRLEEAGKAFDAAVELNPKNASAQINLKHNRGLRENQNDSILLSEEVREMMSGYRGWDDLMEQAGPLDEPEFCFELGKHYATAGLTRQASKQFDRAQSLDPNNLEARLWLANLLLSTDVTDIIQDSLQVIKRLKSEKYEALSPNNLAEMTRIETIALVKLNRLQEAEGKLSVMVEEFPNNETLLKSQLYLYQTTKDWPKALEVLDKQLSLKPDRIDALLYKSVIYIVELKEFEKAVEATSRILQIETDHVPATLNQAIANLQLNNLDAAEKGYQRLLKIIPEDQLFRVYYGLGEIAWRRDNKSTAREFFGKFLEVAPENNPDIQEVESKLQQIGGSSADE